MDEYILDADGNPVPCDDVLEWAKWFQGADRCVAKTEISDGVNVSTVFLGLDHNFMGGTPVLWETMIFGGPHDQYCDRYTSREDALRGHEMAVAIAKG